VIDIDQKFQAVCDACNGKTPFANTREELNQLLDRNYWSVFKERVICKDCIRIHAAVADIIRSLML
jgi:hypothetical protein